MSWWRRLRHRDRLDGELDRELRDHVERQVAEHVRAGLPEDEARRRARVEFGGLDHIKEQCRDARGTRWLDETWQDLRFAVRLLAGRPSFTVVTVLVLGLGMGVTTQFFTMFDALTSRSLPIDAPERVVHISTRDGRARPGGVSYADFEDIRNAATSFGALAAYEAAPAAVAEDDRAPARLQRVFVSAAGLRLLGEAPVLGRDFRAADEQRAAPPVVLLAGHVWRDRYGGDRTVVGRTIRIDGEPAEVIGVMPDGFRFPRLADLWQPVSQVAVADLADRLRDRRTFGVIEGRPPTPVELLPTVVTLTTGPAYFDALGVALLRGRPFSERDGAPGAEAAIVNARFVEIHFPDEEALGRRIRLVTEVVDERAPWLTIVGVAPTLRQRPGRREPDPLLYLPSRADPPRLATLLARAPGDPASAAALVRETVRRIDPDLPLFRVRTLERALDDASWNGRMSEAILWTIAFIALVLSTAGLFAVTSHAVERQMRDLGVRIALGARPRQVSWMVLRRVVRHLAMGTAVGAVGIYAWATLLPGGNAGGAEGLLARLMLFAPGPAVVTLVGLMASLGPVRRAVRLDPMTVLRRE